MTERRAAIAVAFLSVPGFGFIAGINITDKNMREIGFLLGTAVQKWHIGFFIKQRWMVVLIGGGRREPVFARALTTPTYSVAEQDGEFAISIEGAVRDCCYARRSDVALLGIHDISSAGTSCRRTGGS